MLKKLLLTFTASVFVLNGTSFGGDVSIAMIQYDADSHYGQYDLNVANLTDLAISAASDGAQLIILPEGSTYGYASASRLWCRPGMRTFMGKNCDDVSKVAEEVHEGKTTKYWAEFSSTHQVTVVFSIMEKKNGAYFNTAVAVGPDGLVGSYQKQHLYSVDEAYATPGTKLFILELFGKSFGIMICMDTNYSSLFQSYKDAGASAIIAPMDWDQSPNSARAGSVFFRQQAKRNTISIYVSDQSKWDSTGYYPASGAVRIRAPLAPVDIGVDGYSLVDGD